MAKVRRTTKAAGAHGVNNPSKRGKVEAADRSGTTASAPELSVVDGEHEVTSTRVSALREQIANGTYAPDPREVARAILKRGL